MNRTIWLCRILGLAIVISYMAGVQAQQSAAEQAVEAAKQYSGTTINMVWPAGVGALGQKVFAAPLFEQLTGVKVNVVEAPPTDVYIKVVAEHRAGTGGFDVVSLVPSWLTDLSIAGILEPLDEFVEQYGFGEELQGRPPSSAT